MSGNAVQGKKPIVGVWVMFGIYAIAFLFLAQSAQQVWLSLAVWSTMLALVLLVRFRLPDRRGILFSLGLSLLSALALSPLSLLSFSAIQSFFCTFTCSLACCSVFTRYKKEGVRLLRTESVRQTALSVLLGLAVGAVWGLINYALISGNTEPQLSIAPEKFLIALNPAVYEEIVCRTIFYAFCLVVLGGAADTRFHRFTCYFMMIIPHVLPHTFSNYRRGSLMSFVAALVLYALIFGLPFALLQRKRDLTSAMLAHWVVDVVRYSFFGI